MILLPSTQSTTTCIIDNNMNLFLLLKQSTTQLKYVYHNKMHQSAIRFEEGIGDGNGGSNNIKMLMELTLVMES